MHADARLADPLLAAPQLLGRGVYRLPVLRDSRPVLVAVSAAGELLAVRRVPEDWTVRAAWAALWAWLERRDPVVRLRLVAAPPVAVTEGDAPILRRSEPFREVGSPYDEVPVRRLAPFSRRRRPLTRPSDAASAADRAMWLADQVRRAGTYRLPRRPA